MSFRGKLCVIFRHLSNVVCTQVLIFRLPHSAFDSTELVAGRIPLFVLCLLFLTSGPVLRSTAMSSGAGARDIASEFILILPTNFLMVLPDKYLTESTTIRIADGLDFRPQVEKT